MCCQDEYEGEMWIRKAIWWQTEAGFIQHNSLHFPGLFSEFSGSFPGSSH